MYRKEAAGDLYIQASSAHPESLKIGMIKGEVISYISLCSQEKGFDKAWNRFAKASRERGCTAKQLEKAKLKAQRVFCCRVSVLARRWWHRCTRYDYAAMAMAVLVPTAG